MLKYSTLTRSILMILFFQSLFFYPVMISKSFGKDDPTFQIQAGTSHSEYKRSDLLKRKDLELLETEKSPTYPGRKLTLSVIPVAKLLSGLKISNDAIVQFHCLDGFSGPIDKTRLLNQEESKAIAYLAIEPENEKWPPIDSKKGPTTAGPFYLVWKNPEKSKIGQEEWPFQLVSFEVKPSLHQTFPALFPKTKLSGSQDRGLQSFVKNCFTCHTLNLQGESNFGPDLNIPMSPTEYFKESALRSLIRNPQNLRKWKQSQMKGFSEKEISPNELNDLMDYLKVMAKNKSQSSSLESSRSTDY